MDEIIRGQDLVYDYTVQTEDGAEPEVRRALDHLDIAIEKGSFVAILGHNGSGKSTLAKLINGIYTPTEGTLLVEGIDTRNEEQIWEVRRTAGMVFQNPDNQIIANVVEEDVGFGPENMGVPTDDIWKRVDESLSQPALGRTEAESGHRRRAGDEAGLHRAG